MNYNMTEPCNECPFLVGSGFTWRSLVEHASGEFACHKACVVNDETGDFEARNDKTPHCAGALIFNIRHTMTHQMARICERLGMYDRSMLNMRAAVGKKLGDYR